MLDPYEDDDEEERVSAEAIAIAGGGMKNADDECDAPPSMLFSSQARPICGNSGTDVPDPSCLNEAVKEFETETTGTVRTMDIMDGWALFARCWNPDS
jgi:hypothetical protein